MSEGPKRAEAGVASQPPSGDEATLLARRMLLKRGFVAPAVLASFVLAQDAFGQASPGGNGNKPPPKPSFCDKHPEKPQCASAFGFDDAKGFEE